MSKKALNTCGLSLAAAMTLGFVPGGSTVMLASVRESVAHVRGRLQSQLRILRLGRGEAQDSGGQKIHPVPWKTFATKDVIEAIKHAPDDVGRVCVSMITHPRCKEDTLALCRTVATETGKAVSLLISPTLLKKRDLVEMKEAGADRVGVPLTRPLLRSSSA